MTKKHLQFCIYYMQVGDPQVAYKMTYPRAAVKSLAAASSRLMARPEVAEWVNGTEERVHKRLMRKFENEHYDKFKDQLLTINQKRTVLTKIITGETKRIRYIKGKYGPQKVEEDLPVYAVLRAVDLDTRLENFYNYLTRSDTWRKAQNIYVNTPTLQQQVNILINQTTENEENKEAQQQVLSPATCGSDTLSPAGGGVTVVTGVEHSRKSDNTSPRPGVPIAIGIGVPSRPTGNTSPRPGVPIAIGIGVHSRPTGNTSPHSGDLGVNLRGRDNMLPKQNLSPDCSTPPSQPRGEGQGVRSLAPHKTPRFLTKLNKMTQEDRQTSSHPVKNNPRHIGRTL